MSVESHVVVLVIDSVTGSMKWQHNFAPDWNESDAGIFLQAMDSIGGYTNKTVTANYTVKGRGNLMHDSWRIRVRHGYMEIFVPKSFGDESLSSFYEWKDLLEGIVWRRQFLNSLQEEE